MKLAFCVTIERFLFYTFDQFVTLVTWYINLTIYMNLFEFSAPAFVDYVVFCTFHSDMPESKNQYIYIYI